MVVKNISNELNNDINVKKHLKVIFLDLLCTMPYYDVLLVSHMKKQNPLTLMAATSFRRNMTYFKQNGITNGARIIDLVSKHNFRSDKIRLISKTLEYAVNLAVMWLRFIISRPDIVHIQWMPRIYEFGFELWFMKAVKVLRIKQIYTMHNILPHDTGRKYEKLFAEVYKLVDGIICHTDGSKQQLIDEFGIPASKIKVIPFGPMLHESTSVCSIKDAKIKLEIPEDSITVLAFGLIKPYKGIDFLLKSWSAVVKANPNALLVIAGSGDSAYLDYLNGIIDAEGIRNSVVTHFKYLTDDELNIYHQAADILVYPYENITQSAAILTGMSFGKPIVATNITGFSEIIDNGKSGLLFQPGDTINLSHALNNLLQSPTERERLGRNVLDDVNSRFSWDNAALSTLDFYRNVLDSEYGD
ncbi:MAG: glycosyltransferase family 4 protein [Armatimonadota bacterium]